MYVFRGRTIGFRTYSEHMTNLRNSIFLCYNIDIKTFCSSSCFIFRNSLDNFDIHFKAPLTYSVDIVDSALLKEHSKYKSIINGISGRSICKKKLECISTFTPTHKDCNKRLLHFGASSLFNKNHFITQNNCNIKQISSFSGQENNIPFTKDNGLFQSISESPPVQFTQEYLVWFHSYTDLPWWATIILATIIVRTAITLPLAMYQHYILAKLENLKYEMNDVARYLKRSTAESGIKFNWPENYTKSVYQRALRDHWNKMVVAENCHPMKSAVLVLVQIPVWITLSFSLRNLCNMLPSGNPYAHQLYIELTTGGFGWISNLTEVDPFLILPVSIGLLNLIIIEIQSMLRVTELTRLQKITVNVVRFMAVLIIPLAAWIPSCISLYWMTSSACGLCHNLLLVSPKFRRIGRIPETELELSHPYKHLYKQLKNKFSFEKRPVKENSKNMRVK